MAASGTSKTFQLVPEKGFLSCFAASGRIPTATVTVQKGSSNDTLVLSLKNFKPGLAFDLFTVEDSNLLPDGDPDPDFINFGFAWYQSVIQVNKVGGAKVKIQTILVNQIFGFHSATFTSPPDAAAASNIAPTNTFHVGFWFNNPGDAQPCGFDPAQATPFNPDHNAGPAAMISVPDATTNLGPLCLNKKATPGNCNP
jgi:hypothetical protein